MLAVKFICENSELVKKDLQKREEKEKIAWVDEIIEKHREYRKIKEESDKLRHKRNVMTREISEARKQGRDIKEAVTEAKQLPKKIVELERKMEELQSRITYILQRLPNILHESVPTGKSDVDNKEVRKWGTPKKLKELKSHGELLEELNLADFKRAAKISGTGFQFTKGDLVKLELALIDFAVKELEKKGFTPIIPPYMMRRKPYEGVVALTDFENVMYKTETDDSYLIATSEHPITAMYMDEVLDEKELPLRFCGISTNFRKEIGSHGVDTRGLFRVHQFNKVEMLVLCSATDSWNMHEELLATAESLIKKLELPYRVVNVCTGDIGTIAAKKYDIEAWYPRQNKYREVVSCSNCTDYQSAFLNIKYRKSDNEKEYVHTLNSTGLAIGRTMVAIVENYQNPNGSVNVPAVLQAYMGKKVIGR